MKWMRLLPLTFLLACGVLAGAPSTDTERQFVKGAEAYDEREYEKAIHTWSTIIRSGSTSPGLFYNLGNAYMKSGHYPQALSLYEKARLLDPGDPDIQANRQLVRDRLNALYAKRPFWINAARVLSYSGWKRLCQFSLWAACILFAGTLLVRSSPTFLPGVATAFLTVFLLCLPTLWIWNQLFDHPDVIALMDLDARYAPLEDSPVHFELPAGSSIIFEDSDRGWHRIRYEGKSAWIPSDSAVRTVPLSELPN